jgi:hypothetical protein
MEHIDNINENAIDQRKYYDLGFEYAQDSKTNPEIIDNGLNKARALFREDSVSITKKHIVALKANIATLTKNKTDYETTKTNKEIEKEEIENEIDGKKEAGEWINFSFKVLLFIALSFYLFIFYTSVACSAFCEVKLNSFAQSFFIPNALDIASMQGNLFLVLVFPIVAFACGWAFEEGFRNRKVSEKRKISIKMMILSLFVAFIIDIILGYLISERVHNAMYAAGKIRAEWKRSFVFTDMRFYLVLFLGYFVYLLWGYLSSSILNDSIITTRDLRKKFVEIKTQINTIEGDISNLKNQIDKTQENVNDYENGGVFYDIKSFEGIIGIFMQGYSAYVSAKYTNIEGVRVMNTVEQKQREWTNRVILTLNTETI